jgi:hypothetical protein
VVSRRRFLVLAGSALAVRPRLWEADRVPSNLDHILLGISDLDRGIAWVEERTGVRAIFGGVHPGRGTRNALLSLGGQRYLEIIAPDPQQPGEGWYDKLIAMTEPRLFDWAVHTSNIVALAEKVKAAGFTIDGPNDGSRSRPDGKTLRWKSFRLHDDRGGLLPFFIEWGRDSLHPSQDAPKGCTLKQLFIESSSSADLVKQYKLLGIDVEVANGTASRVRATISTAKGEVEL